MNLSVEEIKKQKNKFLLVEDDPAVLLITTRMLKRSGYTVLTAKNGYEALSLLQDNHDQVALVITDVIMNGMDGGELAAHVQAHWPEVGILFISGYLKESLVRQGLIPENSELLHKPFLRDELLKAVSLLSKASENVGLKEQQGL